MCSYIYAFFSAVTSALNSCIAFVKIGINCDGASVCVPSLASPQSLALSKTSPLASITVFTLYIFTVYSAIYGLLFFNEQLEYYHYLGTALVFVGVYLVKKKSKYEKKT